MKNISKKLGVDTQGQPLTKAICLDKVRRLKKALKAHKFPEGSLLRKYAVYYKNWYAWRAKQFGRKGTRKAA